MSRDSKDQFGSDRIRQSYELSLTLVISKRREKNDTSILFVRFIYLFSPIPVIVSSTFRIQVLCLPIPLKETDWQHFVRVETKSKEFTSYFP